MQEFIKGIVMVAFAGGIGLTLAAVDKEVLPTLDGTGASDTTLTNSPPEKVEGKEPGVPPKNPGVGEQPGPAEPNPGEPPEGEQPEMKEPELPEPSSLPPAPTPGEKPEKEPESLPPPEPGPPGEKKPGGAIEGEKEAPYIPTEKLGADAAVDFPVDI